MKISDLDIKNNRTHSAKYNFIVSMLQDNLKFESEDIKGISTKLNISTKEAKELLNEFKTDDLYKKLKLNKFKEYDPDNIRLKKDEVYFRMIVTKDSFTHEDDKEFFMLLAEIFDYQFEEIYLDSDDKKVYQSSTINEQEVVEQYPVWVEEYLSVKGTSRIFDFKHKKGSQIQTLRGHLNQGTYFFMHIEAITNHFYLTLSLSITLTF
jgi:hypothetical protein